MINNKYLLCEWERNGYDDSDFYAAYYDALTGRCHSEMFSSTRFASPCHVARFAKDPSTGQPRYNTELTREIVENSRQWLEKRLFEMMVETDLDQIARPSLALLTAGTKIALTRPVRNRSHFIEQSTVCVACSGSGKWVNPRNDKDVRSCLYCKGTARRIVRSQKSESLDGKPIWENFPEGSVGSISGGPYFFGTFYKRGYKQKNTATATFFVTMDNGKTAKIPGLAIKLARQPVSELYMAKAAWKASYHYDFGHALGCTAWLSDDYVTKDLRVQLPVYEQET